MIKDIFLKDFFLSPIFWHSLLLLVSCIKAVILKVLSRANESAGWDAVVLALLFFNPFFAFFADSFWNIWLQSLVLGLPLYFFGFYVRNNYFGYADYSDAAAAGMISVMLFAFGHFFSGAFLLLRFLWQSV